jgi:hypothetical protein
LEPSRAANKAAIVVPQQVISIDRGVMELAVVASALGVEDGPLEGDVAGRFEERHSVDQLTLLKKELLMKSLVLFALYNDLLGYEEWLYIFIKQ